MPAHIVYVSVCIYARTLTYVYKPETKRLNGGKTDGRTDGHVCTCVCMCPRRICIWDPVGRDPFDDLPPRMRDSFDLIAWRNGRRRK
jgi:hypothetical protein